MSFFDVWDLHVNLFEEAMARLDKVRAAVNRRNWENKMKPKEWCEYTKYMNSLSNEERVALVKEEMDGFIARFGLDRKYMFNLLETMRQTEPKNKITEWDVHIFNQRIKL